MMMMMLTMRSSATPILVSLFLFTLFNNVQALQNNNNNNKDSSVVVVVVDNAASSLLSVQTRDLEEEDAVTTTSWNAPIPQRRATMRARTTLLNLNLGNDEQQQGGGGGGLSPDEMIFFEDSWKAAYNEVHSTDGNDREDMHARSVIIERQDYPNPPLHRRRRRQRQRKLLRGTQVEEEDNSLVSDGTTMTTTSPPVHSTSQEDRSLYYYSKTYVDIWIALEITCFLCDPDYRHLEQNQNESGEDNSNVSMTVHRRLEWNFCNRLQTGPYDTFQGVDDCRIAYLAN